VIISDMTVLLCGSSQTHLGTEMPSGGGHIIRAPKKGTGQDHVGLIGPEDGGDSDGSKKKKLMDETIYNFERNKTDQTEKMRLTFRIRIRDYKLCQILADSRGISASHVVRMALSEYFQRQDIENEICAKLQRNSTAE